MGEVHEAGRLFAIYNELEIQLDVPRAKEQAIAAVSRVDELVFDDVWFRYSHDSEWVLKGASFTLRAGHSTGLVGANGAGKSTIVKLICRLYEPTKGSFASTEPRFGHLTSPNIDPRSVPYSRTSWRTTSPWVENVGIGDLAAPDGRITQAVESVGLTAAVNSLNDGLHTNVSSSFEAVDGQRTAGLSGGQWQRLAMARALMRSDRPLLLLDEPTSGLDPQIEHDLRDSFWPPSAGGPMVLLVSHRLASIRRCDEVLVLEDGVVVQRGSHDELMLAAGTYEALFSAQAEGYQQ